MPQDTDEGPRTVSDKTRRSRAGGTLVAASTHVTLYREPAGD